MKKIFAPALLFSIALITGVVIGRAVEEGEISGYTKIDSSTTDISLDNYDRFGASIADIGDVNGDGNRDLAVGAIGDDDGSATSTVDYYGAVYILFLTENGEVDETIVGEDNGVASNGYTKISQSSGDFEATLPSDAYFGIDIAGIGDLNGDGTVDIAVGSHQDDDGGTNRGAVYVIFLDTDGTVKESVQGVDNGVAANGYTKISSTSGGASLPLINSSFFGRSVDVFDDLNGDGVQDLVVGAYRDKPADIYQNGGVYVIFLTENGTPDLTVSGITDGAESLGFSNINETSGDFEANLPNVADFGMGVAVVDDLNGDGIQDLVVGAPNHDDGGNNKGALYVLFMDEDGTVNTDVAGVEAGVATNGYTRISQLSGGFNGTFATSASIGSDISGIGDINGDGYEDLIAGAVGDDDGGADRGAVYIFYLSADGQLSQEVTGVDNEDIVYGYSKISSTSGGFDGTIYNAGKFGSAVDSVGDIDGDGIVDIFVGSMDDLGSGTTAGGAIFSIFTGSYVPTSGSSPAAMYPSIISAELYGDPVCSIGLNGYIKVRGTNLQMMFVSNNERFVGATTHAYNPRSNPNQLPLSISESGRVALLPFNWAVSGDSVYVMGRSSTGHLSSIQEIDVSGINWSQCNYDEQRNNVDNSTLPVEEEETDTDTETEDEEDTETETPDVVDPETPEDSDGENGETPDMPDVPEAIVYDSAEYAELIRLEGTNGPIYFVGLDGKKHPFRYQYVFDSWMATSEDPIYVTAEYFHSLELAEPMVYQGPTIVKYMTQNEWYYVDAQQNMYRYNSPALMNEQFGEDWRSHVQLLPAHMYSHLVVEDTITRYHRGIAQQWLSR